jgi:transcriptional regulator with XRE-family HTH domain
MVSKSFARFLSQEELAERADLASKMVSLIERFERNPTVNVADSIARAMNVPLWRLIKDAEDLRNEKGLSKAKR